MGYTGYRIKDFLLGKGISINIIKRPRKYGWFHESIKDVRAYCIEKGIDLGEGFKVLPRRWVVERTFAWFNKYRRLSKDYELSIKSSAAFIWTAMLRLLVKRIGELCFI
jgi:transposase